MQAHSATRTAEQPRLVNELKAALRDTCVSMDRAAAQVGHDEVRSLLVEGATKHRDALRRLQRVAGAQADLDDASLTRSEDERFDEQDDATTAEMVARKAARLALIYAQARDTEDLPETLRAICMRGEGECRRHVEALVAAAVDLKHGVAEDEETFNSELAELESAATVPAAVGEAQSWSEALRAQLERTSSRYELQRRRHEQLRREMAQEDPHLNHRRARLDERETIVAGQLRELLADATDIASAELEGHDEPQERARKLRVGVLAWCVAARALEAEVQSSYLEAHYRDRGTVD